MVADLDRWRHDLAKRLRKEPDSRPEAIRAILEGHFEGARSLGLREDARRAQETKQAARHMAGQVIDDLADPAASVDERAKRKRRLLKGPGEFREIRGDQPAPSRPKRSKQKRSKR
jgi:hypothetical protein